MSEAVILRTKTLLSDGDEDLPIESAIRKLIYLLPSNAARLGFLLDLTGTDVGKKYGKPIRVQLGILLAKLHTVTDLFPRKTDDTTRQEYLDALKKRVGMSALPDELKDSFEASLQKIASIKKSDMKPKSSPILEKSSNSAGKKEGAEMNGKTVLAAGELLFSEGDSGDTAYYIVDGTVEVFRSPGGVEKLLSNASKGEIIGEMSLIDNQPRMASVRALTDTKLACISQEDLTSRIGKLKDDDMVMYHVMRTLVRRLRGTARDEE